MLTKNLHTYFLMGTLLLLGTLKAQPELPPQGDAFADSLVPRIDILIDADTLAWIYEHVDSNTEFHATFIYDKGNLKDTIENAGFRLRGNTSRDSEKKSFKVSFNTYEPGRKWHGLEKLNLNGEHNDPSVIRSKLCWDLLNDLGIPASRANHVQLYINNAYHGLYINVEHIDEEFVRSRFGNNDGNLYKCLWPADLDYLGSNPDNYKLTKGDRRVYDLKTNTGADDYSDLANLIDVINNTPDEDFLCEIGKIFNIYDYLRIMAFDVFTANWDGYIFNQNNFYLYHNTETGKFEYINYDLDNTFGIDWFDIIWSERDIYDWDQGYRPLYSRIMGNDELRAQYTAYLDYFSSQLIGTTSFSNRVNSMKWKHAPYISPDPYYPLDYGFTYNDYIDSFDAPLGMHVKAGLLPYIADRKNSVSDQLDNTLPKPAINYIRNNHPQAGEDFKVRAFVDLFDEEAGVNLVFSINGGAVQQVPMLDDGNHWDKEAGDHLFGCMLPDIGLNTTISYQVIATGINDETSIMPCEPNVYQLIESAYPGLFINEFMADNKATIPDEQGEFDDWIEIYNGDDTPVWLGDKYLSDNLNNEDKWQMPDVVIQPGDFMLFWADDDPEQGEHHTNFKLDAAGEEIGLFDAANTGFHLLDSVSFGIQTADVSTGRSSDGGNLWMTFSSSTPGSSNSGQGVNSGYPGKPVLAIYPNPVVDGWVSFDRPTSFQLFSSTGMPVFRANNTQTVYLGNLGPGLYLLTASSGQSTKLMIR